MHIVHANDTWLYEQPPIAPLPTPHVNLLEASTPLKTPPMNLKTLIKNVVALDTPIVFNPQTPKSINETSC